MLQKITSAHLVLFSNNKHVVQWYSWSSLLKVNSDFTWQRCLSLYCWKPVIPVLPINTRVGKQDRYRSHYEVLISSFSVRCLSISMSECSLFTSGLNDFSQSSQWLPSSSVSFWTGCVSGISWPQPDALRFSTIASLVSLSVSDSPDELISSDRWLFFLCFFLLFVFLLFLWCRCAFVPLGVSSFLLSVFGLFSRLRLLLFFSLLELLDFSLTFPRVSESLSRLSLPLLLFLYLSFSRLPFLNLSESLSLRLLLLDLSRLLLRHRSFLLSVCPDLDDRLMSLWQ